MTSEWRGLINLSSLACPNKEGMNELGATCQSPKMQNDIIAPIIDRFQVKV